MIMINYNGRDRFMSPNDPDVPMTEDDQPELWRKWLPGVHRAIAYPDAPVPLPQQRKRRSPIRGRDREWLPVLAK